MQHIHVGSAVDLRVPIKVILTMPHIIALSTAGVSRVLSTLRSPWRECAAVSHKVVTDLQIA